MSFLCLGKVRKKSLMLSCSKMYPFFSFPINFVKEWPTKVNDKRTLTIHQILASHFGLGVKIRLMAARIEELWKSN